jgi:hypothetical protein
MKIDNLAIDNFLRITRLRLDLTAPTVHLVGGYNEAGKTSLLEAIRFCLLGETDRVTKKGDYKLMVKDGNGSGQVRVTIDGRELGRDVSTGRGNVEDFPGMPENLEYLLDATRYVWLDEKTRRKFMFKLMKINVKPEDVKDRLVDQPYNVPEYMVDTIMPMLKAGFDPAHTYCREKATEARGAWRECTGETYGAKKAVEWEPKAETFDLTAYTAMIPELKKADDLVEELAAAIGEAKASAPSMALGHLLNCPACDARLCLDNSHVPPVRVVTKEEEERSAKDMMQLADEFETPTRIAFENAKSKRDNMRAEHDAMQAQRAILENSDEIKKRALTLHTQVAEWVTAADALAPTGIPADLISERIKPLNDRLRQTSMTTGWPQVAVTPDMKILVENRLFALQSESSQWRAQAAIAEAISFLSKVGILILDRVDVLDINNRKALIKWVLDIREAHNNILIIGTFKEPPKVPDSIRVHWLEDGKLVEAEAA